MPDEALIMRIALNLRDAALPILVIIAGALCVLRFARPVIRKALRRAFRNRPAEVQKRVNTFETLGMSALRFAVAVLALALVLAALNLGQVIAALGLVLAVVAFAGQDFVRDCFAGTIIVLENQFCVGDEIKVAGVTGVVEDFTLRRTRLRDVDGTLHIVSNGVIRVASNQTRGYAGIDLDVPIGYSADVDRAMTVIDEVGAALAADPSWAGRILEAPVAVRVGSLSDTGVSIKVRGKVRAGDQWAASGELRRRVLAAFARSGIALPHRNVIVERLHAATPPKGQ